MEQCVEMELVQRTCTRTCTMEHVRRMPGYRCPRKLFYGKPGGNREVEMVGQERKLN